MPLVPSSRAARALSAPASGRGRASRAWRVGRLVVLFAVVAVLVSACDAAYPASGATIQGRDIRNLYDIILIPAVVIFFLVEGLLVWSLVRYRRRSQQLPTQTHGNMALEITWTVIPLMIVLGVFALSMQTLGRVDAKTSKPDVVVDVTGKQWFWDFSYANEKVTVSGAGTVPTIDLPVGRTIRFRLHSDNVIHSFYIPQFLFKRDVIPGLNNEFDITITQEGIYTGQCAEFCGFGHADMQFKIAGVSDAQFADWVKQQQAAANATPTPGASLGPNAKTLEVSATTTTSFEQSTLSVPAGQPFAIHFTNKTASVPHNVAIKDSSGKVLFKTKIITGVSDDTETAPALQPGSYTFFCEVHPNMQGTLTVQ